MRRKEVKKSKPLACIKETPQQNHMPVKIQQSNSIYFTFFTIALVLVINILNHHLILKQKLKASKKTADP